MPAPVAASMQELAAQHFRGLGITLPMDWSDPSSDEEKDQYSGAFAEGDRQGHTPKPAGLFRAATTNKIHADTADDISSKIRTYMDGVVAAICSAWSTWQSAASMSGVVVAGPTASGGALTGPALKGLILAEAPQATPEEARYSKAIASAIDTAWSAWVASVKVPGLPWYPAFAAFPGPMAPPTPNIPAPVVALTQVATGLSMSALKGAMVGELGDSKAQHHAAIFESVASAFDQSFVIWQSSTMVTNVLGTGPIPTFAPPVVPVGPVVGGTGTMAPGGLV